MNDSLENIKHEIIYVSPVGCWEGGEAERIPYRIYISSVETENDRWIAKGRGEMVLLHCHRGAAMYQAIMHKVPIDCAPFPCPKCGGSQDLKYRLEKITTDKQTFEFEVIIECTKCSRKNSLRKVLEKILEIIKVEVKPTGITIKKS